MTKSSVGGSTAIGTLVERTTVIDSVTARLGEHTMAHLQAVLVSPPDARPGPESTSWAMISGEIWSASLVPICRVG